MGPTLSSGSLPILALPHPHVLLPGSRISISVSRQLAQPLIKLLTDAADDTLNEVNVLVGAVPLFVEKKPGEVEDGQSTGNAATKLCEWGCSARVIRIVRPPTLQASQMHIVTLQGVQRIQLTPPIPTPLSNPPLRPHSITYPPTPFPLNQQTLDLFRATTVKLLQRLSVDDAETRKTEGKDDLNSQRSLASLLLGGSAGGNGIDPWGKLSKLVNEADDERLPWISDQVMSLVGRDFDEKIEHLTLADCEARLRFAINVFTRQLSIAEVTSSVSKSIEENLSKQQKEFFLRQQKAAIDRELANLRNTGSSTGPKSELDGEPDEANELADLKAKIELLVPGSEERTMAVREFKRLKRIQSSSVEHGVIRTYLEWLTSLPWPQTSDSLTASSPSSSADMTDRALLTRARDQLESDHYGMDKVKRRLIEYLAVVRLKAIEAKKAEMISSGPASAPAETKATLGKEPKSPKPEGSSAPPKAPSVKVSTNKGPILLLYGPPGVGKTSIAQSLAEALNLPFQRISLGGVRDEAEIRGHRRTYVASGPGNIVQALRKAGRPDPVILLDEIDKVGHASNHGDPAAALLEVLDPEQNCTFSDHYINVPIDLSQVLFIATANTLDTISAPLLDRCEALRLSGYTQSEKLKIAKRYLIPKQLRANGLQVEDASVSSRCEVTDDAVKAVIGSYTREAGVRGLERQLGAVVRFKAVEWSEADRTATTVTDASRDRSLVVSSSSVLDASSPVYSPVVVEEDLEAILGPAIFEGEERNPEAKKGVVYGLVVMGEGEGGILPVETAILPGTGHLKLSGSLGDVIRESGELALSWVKANAYALGITPTAGTDPLKHPSLIDIHLHLPAGAQKKDGPSAGVAMAVAFVSLLTGLTVPSTTAMTGEITLRGNVTPVGGVKEKVLGAHRAGISTIVLPERNRRDVDVKDVGKEVMTSMNFVFVRTIEEALREVFGKHFILGRGGVIVESRL
ncbi:hypothetical protein FRB97_002170 [Tulasnella sp. 331]|nr:hypothetical protein FRB97_002170 [Tulasnella sp. 331]